MREPKQPRLDDRAVMEDADFQAAFRLLLFACVPLVERPWRGADSQRAGDDGEELALAGRLFERFFTEDAARRMAGPGYAECCDTSGAGQRCMRDMRECMTFGWVLGRGRRTPRAYAYYLSRFWMQLRNLGGQTAYASLPEPERLEIQALLAGLAGAYGLRFEWLPEGVDYLAGSPDESLLGQVDVSEIQKPVIVFFEQALALNMAKLHSGEEAKNKVSTESQRRRFHDWPLHALRFGYGLGRSRTLSEVLRCLMTLFRSLREHSGSGMETAEQSGRDGHDEPVRSKLSCSSQRMPICVSRRGVPEVRHPEPFPWGGRCGRLRLLTPAFLDSRPIASTPCVKMGCRSGRGAAWLARLLGVQEVPGSNPGGPTSLNS